MPLYLHTPIKGITAHTLRKEAASLQTKSSPARGAFRGPVSLAYLRTISLPGAPSPLTPHRGVHEGGKEREPGFWTPLLSSSKLSGRFH